MKKSKLSLCLASSFVAALSLSACNAVSESKDAVVTVKDANGHVRQILTNAIYDEYKKTSGGVSKFYNAILESLIRYEYENTNPAIRDWGKVQGGKALKSLSEIKDEAENNVKNDKNTANENAKTNGTSYETEWNSILSSHDCLPEDGDSESGEDKLRQYYIYQLEKEDITDKFFLFQKDQVTSEWLGVKQDGSAASTEVMGAFPYHIRHILASISGGSSNFYNGTITADEARKLGNIMESLLDDKLTFAQVARANPDDSGSAEKGGDLGIMSTNTSFVNEFKLGIYAFDSIFKNHDDAANDTIRHGLGIDKSYEFQLKDSEGKIQNTNPLDAFDSKINKGQLQEVPYDAFLKIKQYAEDVKDNNGKQVNNGNEHYYPRNVLYNYYLNFHNPFIITRQQINTTTGFPKDDTTGDKYDLRFTTVSIKGVNKEALCDDKGNVIIGVRSEHGIHFMVMEKSIYDYKVPAGQDVATLSEYYTTLIPGDENFPKKADGEEKDTYVGYFAKTDESTYNSRVNDIKTQVKSFDSTYDYRLFSYILNVEGENIQIRDAALRTNILDYIVRTRANNRDNNSKSLNEAWRSYAELVALQYDNRTTYTEDEKTITGDKTVRTIHPRCAVGFKSHSADEWKEGGVCYYED